MWEDNIYSGSTQIRNDAKLGWKLESNVVLILLNQCLLCKTKFQQLIAWDLEISYFLATQKNSCTRSK